MISIGLLISIRLEYMQFGLQLWLYLWNVGQSQVGTLLYVRVVKANTGMNPELSCTDGN